MIKIALIISLIVTAILIGYSILNKNKATIHSEYSDDEHLNQMYIDIGADFDNPTTEKFKNAFQSFIEYAEKGDNGCAHMIAEVYAGVEPYKNIEKAYFWYYVYFAGQGYSMEFNNQEESNGHYYGKTGDFRNESMVAELVDEIGFEKVKKIDVTAREFILSIDNQK